MDFVHISGYTPRSNESVLPTCEEEGFRYLCERFLAFGVQGLGFRAERGGRVSFEDRVLDGPASGGKGLQWWAIYALQSSHVNEVSQIGSSATGPMASTCRGEVLVVCSSEPHVFGVNQRKSPYKRLTIARIVS